jgi:thiamine phosphate synthase YjbQ (UPF0047 family)
MPEMKNYRKELKFHLPSRMGFVNITSQVESALRDSGIREGLCLVNAMHITASVFINDDEQALLERTTGTPITSARSWVAK